MTEVAGTRLDDTALIRRCRRGDADAMEQLVIRYQNRIYNVIFKMCANAADAAELTQDTFVKVIENIDKFGGRSSFYTWAFRIAVNLTLNYCHRSSKFGHRSLDAGQDQPDQQAGRQLKRFLNDDSSPDPAALAQNKEVLEMVQKALDKLDAPRKAVVVLRDIEGMSYAQIAEVLNIELGTVKSRLSRARGNLKEILENMMQ